MASLLEIAGTKPLHELIGDTLQFKGNLETVVLDNQQSLLNRTVFVPHELVLAELLKEIGWVKEASVTVKRVRTNKLPVVCEIELARLAVFNLGSDWLHTAVDSLRILGFLVTEDAFEILPDRRPRG